MEIDDAAAANPQARVEPRSRVAISGVTQLEPYVSSQHGPDLTPWAVDAFRSPEEGPGTLPTRASAVLVVRVGEPLGRARGGWECGVAFEVGERYAVFREKCLAKFTAIMSGPEAPKRAHLKRAKNDSQAKFVELNTENFLATLQYRWRLLTPGDLHQIGDFRFEAFLHVQRAAQPEQFHRATSRRVEQARVQRMAYEAANAVQFGAITSHHLDVVHARRPESAPFEVPTDNTTAQALELDRQREALQRLEHAHKTTEQTAVIKIRLNGLWMPVEVDILSLRRAIGLPDHDIFSRGIYHDFTPLQPTNAAMEDEDHQEDELMG